jgi:hypothetical protein
MSTMISEVYDALLSAGAPEEKARKAAEVLADYDSRFLDLRRDLAALDAKLDREAADIRGVQRLHSWMLGYLVLVTTTLLWKVFTG